MSGSPSRRRRLPPPRLEAREVEAAVERSRAGAEVDAPAQAGDLFAHFGVSIEVDRGQPAAIVDGRACLGCGWLVAASSDRACPLCGRE